MTGSRLYMVCIRKRLITLQGVGHFYLNICIISIHICFIYGEDNICIREHTKHKHTQSHDVTRIHTTANTEIFAKYIVSCMSPLLEMDMW